MSAGHQIEVHTGDGVAPCWLHRPAAEGVYPGVILYPDAGSVRHTMHQLADRLAGLGYVVLVPHIFYRSGEYAPFDTRTVFVDPAERDRLRAIIRALEMPAAMRDAARYIEALHDQPGVAAGRIGCTGYCMGGRLAFLTAGAHPGAVAAAASIHGGGVATDAADSPHRGGAHPGRAVLRRRRQRPDVHARTDRGPRRRARRGARALHHRALRRGPARLRGARLRALRPRRRGAALGSDRGLSLIHI